MALVSGPRFQGHRFQRHRCQRTWGPVRGVVAGGGTAGHIEPALAVADAVRRLDPSADITALRDDSRTGNTLVPERGFT